MVVHDGDVGDFMCDLCSEMFKVRRDLKDHSLRHKSMVRGQEHPFKTEASMMEIGSTSHSQFDMNASKSHDNFDGLLDGNRLNVIKQETGAESMDSSGGDNSVRGRKDTPKLDSHVLSQLLEPHFSTVKSEDLDFISGNRQRASVISGMFKVDDGKDNSRSPRLNLTDGGSYRSKTGMPRSQRNKYSEASEFSNHSDFSSPPEDDHSPFDPLIHTKDKDVSFAMISNIKNADNANAFAHGKFSSTNHTHSKQDSMMIGFSGALKHRVMNPQHSFGGSGSNTKGHGSDNVSNRGVESARTPVFQSRPVSDLSMPGEVNHSILQSAITSDVPRSFQMNAAEYLNSILHKPTYEESKQNSAPKKLSSEKIDAPKPHSELKPPNRGNVHSVLDILKGLGSGGQLKAQLQSTTHSSSPSHSTQNSATNIFKSKLVSNKSQSSQGPALTSVSSSSKFRHHPDLSVLAQSYRGSSFVPSSLSNTSGNAGNQGTAVAQDRGGKRPLGNFIGGNDPVKSGFIFRIEDQLKDSLGSEKKQDDASGLLSNF